MSIFGALLTLAGIIFGIPLAFVLIFFLIGRGFLHLTGESKYTSSKETLKNSVTIVIIVIIFILLLIYL